MLVKFFHFYQTFSRVNKTLWFSYHR